MISHVYWLKFEGLYMLYIKHGGTKFWLCTDGKYKDNTRTPFMEDAAIFDSLVHIKEYCDRKGLTFSFEEE